MNKDYWSSTLSGRASRRRLLAGSGAGALGAVLLAACGGGDDKKASGGAKDASGLLYKPVDTTKQAVQGGTFQSFYNRSPNTLDPLQGSGDQSFFFTNHSYQRLIMFKPGTAESPPDGTVEGDAMSSWEISPDGLQVTFKLRQNNKFDQRAPTNGRAMTVNDVKFSWERFSKSAPARADLVRSLNPSAPIESITFPDATTVVVKAAEPNSALLSMLGYSWYLSIVPAEAENNGFNIATEMRGSGPWMLTTFEPSVGWEFKRNPTWFKGPERPYLDSIDYRLILEQAQQLAQFKAKRIWQLAPSADEVLNAKKGSPDALMQGTSPFEGNSGMNLLAVSKLDNSPFWDDRIRRSLGMLLDRDAFIDAFNNVSGFAKEGLTLETGWHNHVPCSWGTVWLDPKTNKLGEASKNLQYNPDEAAKLLKAAGKFPMESDYAFRLTNPVADRQLQVIAQMLQEGGHYKLTLSQKTNDEFRSKYIFNKGQFEGIATVPFGQWPDLDIALWALYSPGGRNDYVGKPVPKAHDLLIKHRREFDLKKRADIAREWQKEMAAFMPAIPYPGDGMAFVLNWPWLANFGAVRAWGGTSSPYAESYPYYWYDKSKDTRSS
jgi:ABC-type transport system substrate-binding protein